MLGYRLGRAGPNRRACRRRHRSVAFAAMGTARTTTRPPISDSQATAARTGASPRLPEIDHGQSEPDHEWT